MLSTAELDHKMAMVYIAGYVAFKNKQLVSSVEIWSQIWRSKMKLLNLYDYDKEIHSSGEESDDGTDVIQEDKDLQAIE